MSTYYTAPPTVVDGDVAYAQDVNSINLEADSGFSQVYNDIQALEGNVSIYTTLAQKWAENAEDSAVITGHYSALHWAAKANASALAAASSALSASGYSTSASEYATTALGYKNSAGISESNASSYASSALSSKNSADADAIATAADRVQTGLDKVATAADRVATAADRVQTGLDRAAILVVDGLQNIGNAGTSLTLSTSSYSTFLFTCDQATLNFGSTTFPTGRTIVLVISGANDCTITWPTGTQWPGGVSPTFSSGTDRVVLQRTTASVIHASLAGASYA